MNDSGRWYRWALQRTESRRAPLWVAFFFLLELILFVPLDLILIFFCLQNRPRILLYVVTATIASTVSASLGYVLGHFLWDVVSPYLVPHFLSLASFEHFAVHYQAHESLAIFLGAFLPFPLKLLAVSAGMFHLQFAPFFLYVFLARALRFSLIGSVLLIWGEKAKRFLDRHARSVMLLLGAKIAVGLALFWTLSA